MLMLMCCVAWFCGWGWIELVGFGGRGEWLWVVDMYICTRPYQNIDRVDRVPLGRHLAPDGRPGGTCCMFCSTSHGFFGYHAPRTRPNEPQIHTHQHPTLSNTSTGVQALPLADAGGPPARGRDRGARAPVPQAPPDARGTRRGLCRAVFGLVVRMCMHNTT